MALEGRLEGAKIRREVVEVKARDAEAKVKAVETIAQAAREEVARAREEASLARAEAQVVRAEAAKAVEAYKGSTDFSDEVAEMAYDAFLKGFKECKNNVSRVLHIANLDDITAEDPKESAEEPVATVVKVVEDDDDTVEAEGGDGNGTMSTAPKGFAGSASPPPEGESVRKVVF